MHPHHSPSLLLLLLFLILCICSSSLAANPIFGANAIASKLQDDLKEGEKGQGMVVDGMQRGMERMVEAVQFLKRAWDLSSSNNVDNNVLPSYTTENTDNTIVHKEIQKQTTPQIEVNDHSLRQSTRDVTCVLPGLLAYRPVSTSTCNGKHCMLSELLCYGNQKVTVGRNEWNTTLFQNCVATKIDCYVGTEIDTIDLKERFNAYDCSIDPVPLMSGGETFAQLVCNNNTNFGYKSFGLPCTTDAFLCGNTTLKTKADIDEHNNTIQTGKCQLIQTYCEVSTGNFKINYTCNEAHDNCSYTIRSVFMGCTRMLNTSVCMCPVDLQGPRCNVPVNFTCSLSLSHPSPSCLPSPLKDPKDYQLDGDRKCVVYNDYKSDVAMGYRLACRPVHPPNLTYVQGFNFSYWINTPTLNITYPVTWALRDKVYNLNVISDTGAQTVSSVLTHDQIIGLDLVWFNFSLKIPEQYWIARRLYHEVAINFGNNPSYSSLYRGYIDAPTRPISTATYSTRSTFEIVVIVLVIFAVLCGIGYVAFKIYKKTKIHNKKTA